MCNVEIVTFHCFRAARDGITGISHCRPLGHQLPAEGPLLSPHHPLRSFEPPSPDVVGDVAGVNAGIASLSCSDCAALAAGTDSERNSACDDPASTDCSPEGEPAARLPVILSKTPMIYASLSRDSSVPVTTPALVSCSVVESLMRTAEEARVPARPWKPNIPATAYHLDAQRFEWNHL